MQNNTLKTQDITKNLQAVAPKHCDNCGNRYNEKDFKVVKSTPAGAVLHLKCGNCNNAYMLNVMSPVDGMIGAQRTPMNLDLTMGDEVQKFAGSPAVERNEAIDIHGALDTDLSQSLLQDLLS